jgi:hypothetical protein
MKEINNEFAKKICTRLDQGIADLDADRARSLQNAREKAMLAASGKNKAWHHLALGQFYDWFIPSGKWVLPAIFVMGLAGFFSYQSYLDQEDMEIDVALLSSDLPLEAYTDQGFDQWVRTKHQSSGGISCQEKSC